MEQSPVNGQETVEMMIIFGQDRHNFYDCLMILNAYIIRCLFGEILV